MLQHKETTKDLFIKISTSLEIIALEMFASHVWKHNNMTLSGLILLFNSSASPAIEAEKNIIIEGCVR